MSAVRTYSARPADVHPTWHVIDAAGQTLGRLATHVARLLQGKHKPIYTRHVITGDFVVVVNAAQVRVSGRKLKQKVYYKHSGYIGNLRKTPLEEVLRRHPDRVMKQAVKGMLPDNILGRQMLRRLKVYGGPTHPHQAQVQAGHGNDSQVTPGQEAPTQAPQAPQPQADKAKSESEGNN
ncbi:MAG: 50S ribosomal protein L13 [Chloroflexi bacterium]|nr:50S ribosomal protein L13 [Chloroflexota bacterium]